VRSTLERRGVQEKGSPRSAVFRDLEIRVKKFDLQNRHPLSEALDYIKFFPTDLIVLATKGREGVPQCIKSSTPEQLAWRTKTMTLFVPNGVSGFVSRKDGALSFSNVVIPVDHHPSPQAAIQIAARAAKVMGDGKVQITLVHVGDSPDMPLMELPEDPSCSWNRMHVAGEVVDQIITVANQVSANLIAMVTEGHDGFLDALRGSVTEQVLRQAPCPVLAVPTAWIDGVTRK
jgi:nucleotide-binding universal stress UspA family protein